MKKLFLSILFFGIVFVTFPTSAQLYWSQEAGADSWKGKIEESSTPSANNVEPVFPSWPQWWRDATPEKVRELLDQGAPVDGGKKKENIIYSHMDTPIMLAAQYSKYPEIINLLAERGANLEDKNILEETPLILAALFSDYPDIIKALLKNNANPLARNIYGQNALFYATDNPSIYNTVAYWALKNKTQ